MRLANIFKSSSVSASVEQLDLPLTVVECELVQPLWKTISYYPEEAKLPISFDPAIPRLYILKRNSSICPCNDSVKLHPAL